MVFIDVGLALLHPLLETAPILLQVRALQERVGDEVELRLLLIGRANEIPL